MVAIEADAEFIDDGSEAEFLMHPDGSQKQVGGVPEAVVDPTEKARGTPDPPHGIGVRKQTTFSMVQSFFQWQVSGRGLQGRRMWRRR